MKNILDKLGISEIDCWTEKIDHDVNHCVEDIQKVKDLEQQNRDLVKALFGLLKHSVHGQDYPEGCHCRDCDGIRAIEKVIGLPWEEIKELSNG